MNIKYNIETAKDGQPTLSVIDSAGNNIFLHSRYSPLKEADSLKDKFSPEKYDALIVLGTGLGYHLLPLKDTAGGYKKVILIDIIKEIKLEIIKNRDTNFLADNSKIVFLAGRTVSEIENALSAEIDLSEIRGLSVIEHPPSMRAFPDYYPEIKRIIEKTINKKAGDSATIRAFGFLYFKNILKNLKSAAGLFPVSSFFGKMQEYPALIITSGPSIEMQLKIIERSQNRFFIIAVDSNAGLLLKNKIIPDFFISIDPQPFIYEHLLGADIGNIIPIYSLSSHPHVFGRKPGLVSLNSHPVCQLIGSLSNNAVGSIDSLTGTVSGDAISACSLFGFRKTALAGFDFSFMDFKIYPRGTAYQKRYANISTRFSTVESANINYILKSSRGVKYQDRFSRKSFIRYKEAIEDFIIKNDVNNLFNVNSSNIAIKGTNTLPLDDFIKNYCGKMLNKKEILSEILAPLNSMGDILLQSRFNEILKDIDVFEEILKTSVSGDLSANKIETLKSLLPSNI